jgi:hypothetical protein
MNLCASDIVFEGLFETFEGRVAVRGFFQDWLDTYDELEVAVEEMRDLAMSMGSWGRLRRLGAFLLACPRR